MANFHVDTSGNLWLGVTSTTFSESAPFYVKANGDVRANSIDLKIQEEDDADGGGGGNKRIDLGDSGSKIYDFGGDIFINASDDVVVKDVLRLAETSGSVSEPTLLFGSSSASSGSQQNPVAGLTSRLVTADTHGGNSSHLARQLEVTNGSTYVMRFNSVNDEVNIPGDIKLATSSDIYIGTDPGSNGEVLMKSGGDIVWGTVGGGSHADSDHTSFVDHVDTSTGGGGGTDALTISNNGIRINFGTTGTRVAVGNHTHSGMVGTGISQINSPSTGFFSGYTFNSTTGAFSVSTSNTNTSSTTVGNLFPNASSSDLGHPFGNGEWDRLYIQNNPDVSSDERKKENIEDLTFGLDYIKTLVPKSYTLKSDENSRVHWGFIAQQLLETPPEPELNIAFVDYQEEHDHYSVAYAELIAPLVKAVQELSTQVSDLTARIEALEG